jgi:hypothetical protein
MFKIKYSDFKMYAVYNVILLDKIKVAQLRYKLSYRTIVSKDLVILLLIHSYLSVINDNNEITSRKKI